MNSEKHLQPLPKSVDTLSPAAKGLLMRLLERDPRIRLRNLRQLQQSAFYMNFDFEHIKTKKVSENTSHKCRKTNAIIIILDTFELNESRKHVYADMYIQFTYLNQNVGGRGISNVKNVKK